MLFFRNRYLAIIITFTYSINYFLLIIILRPLSSLFGVGYPSPYISQSLISSIIFIYTCRRFISFFFWFSSSPFFQHTFILHTTFTTSYYSTFLKICLSNLNLFSLILSRIGATPLLPYIYIFLIFYFLVFLVILTFLSLIHLYSLLSFYPLPNIPIFVFDKTLDLDIFSILHIIQIEPEQL